MGFRFFKRMNILPGVQLNLSKSGGSVSVGPRGAKLTVGTSGGRVTFGIPGTGLSYTTNFSLGRLDGLFGRSVDSGESQTPATSEPSTEKPVRQAQRALHDEQEQVTAEAFDHTPAATDDQKALAAGCQALANSDEDGALAHLQHAAHLADGAFLAGVLSLKKGHFQDAAQYLTAAVRQAPELGKSLSSHGLSVTMNLAITEEVQAHVEPGIHGVLLALAEAYQAQEKQPEAVNCLERLRQLTPGDLVVNLSLAELLMESDDLTKETCQRVVQLTEGVENESAVQTALLLYKAKALRGLGLLDAALEVLTGALKRKKDRSDELLQALRYERTLVYERQGESKKARAELEKLYAEAPDYEDVKTRLGL
jgi:tetratricopeptide (TPR) repeat protein